MIGICTAEQARRTDFYSYLSILQRPIGTMQTVIQGQSIANNRNRVIAQALENGCSHIFFLDDDVICKSDTLIKLICHNVDSVCALQLRRNYPHQPYIFDKFTGNGLEAEQHFLENNEKGLIKIDASGLGACLLKCKVFSKMEEPFFRLGEAIPDMLNEDVGFFKRMKDIGLQHYCDLDTMVGHTSSTTVWPNRNEKEWITTYETGSYESVSFPQVKRPVKEEENVPVGVD